MDVSERGAPSYISDTAETSVNIDPSTLPPTLDLDEYYNTFFNPDPESLGSDEEPSPPPAAPAETDQTGLDALKQEATGAIRACYTYKETKERYESENSDVTPECSFERWCILEATIGNLDSGWESNPKKVETLCNEFARRAGTLLGTYKEELLEKRMNAILNELIQAENAANHGTIEQGGGAMPRDPVKECESRKPFEKTEIEKTCAAMLRNFNKEVQALVRAETRLSRAAKEEVRSMLQQKSKLVYSARKSEFDDQTRLARTQQHEKKMRHISHNVSMRAQAATNPLYRACGPYVSAFFLKMANVSVYRRVVVSVGMLSVVVLAAAVFMGVRTNERARAWLDHEEIGVSRQIPSGVYVKNLRVAPVKGDYREHYRWMLGQSAPAPSFEEHHMRRGFFDVPWRYGRGYNVTFEDMEAWMSRVGGACVCAQHLGFDRFVAYTKGMMLCDPQIVASAVETTRTTPRDWLDDYSPRDAPKTYHVPKTARVEYTGVAGLAAGRRMSVQLDQVGVACVMRCGDWARTEL